jgi:hypothetical protein
MARQDCTGTLLCTGSPDVLLECSDCGWIGFEPDDRHVESLVLPDEQVPSFP